MRGHTAELRRVDDAAKLTPGVMVIDAKNLFDKLQTVTLVVKGAETGSDIEALTLRKSLQRSETLLRWVNGGGRLANALTKTQGWLHINMHFRWRIAYDPKMHSEKNQKAAGLNVLQDTEHTNTPCAQNQEDEP